jgi:hypothetical protein
MAMFNDRRVGMMDVVNPAEAKRASLSRPDKPGQASRAYMARTQRVHNDVMAGHAAVFNPVPSVVSDAVTRSGYSSPTVLPSFQSRGSRVSNALRRLDSRVLGRR